MLPRITQQGCSLLHFGMRFSLGEDTAQLVMEKGTFELLSKRHCPRTVRCPEACRVAYPSACDAPP